MVMNEERFARWIRKCRGKETQEQFGKKLCRYHYDKKSDKNVCRCYHRNEIINWESARNFPSNKETVLSIALFAFDREHNITEEMTASALSDEIRQERLEYANKALQDYLGINLYSRNIHDVLLIQVCRGIITFKETLELETKISMQFAERPDRPGPDTQKAAALEKKTQLIWDDQAQIYNREDIERVVKQYYLHHSTANKVLGFRLEESFKARKRYCREISLKQAVQIFIPNFNQTYKRIYNSFGVTREWLIELCVHLRFNRKEINEVLENAHMAPLSVMYESPASLIPESLIRDQSDHGEELYNDQGMRRFPPVGSGGWYRKLEASQRRTPYYRYKEFMDIKLEDRLCIMILLTACIENESFASLPPPDCFLESFLYNKQSDKALKDMRKHIEKVDEPWNCDISELHRKYLQKKSFTSWADYTKSVYAFISDDRAAEALQEVLEEYREEYREYFNYKDETFAELRRYFDKKASPDLEETCMEEIRKLHYLAALFYTVLTGKIYDGELHQADLLNITKQFQEKGWEYSGRFMENLLGVLLSGNELQIGERRGADARRIVYYSFDQDHKKAMGINLNILKEILWETVIDPK